MIYVFLANGFEEIEALATVDILRRAELDVKTVGVGGKTVTGSHGIPVTADIEEKDVTTDDMELVVLPGGMPGTLNLKAHEGLKEQILTFNSQGKYLAAICAAPTVLSELGILKGKKACAYPSFEEELDCGEVLKVPAVTDGNITTGRGMGAAIPFALRLAAILCGDEKAEEIRKSVVYE